MKIKNTILKFMLKKFVKKNDLQLKEYFFKTKEINVIIKEILANCNSCNQLFMLQELLNIFDMSISNDEFKIIKKEEILSTATENEIIKLFHKRFFYTISSINFVIATQYEKLDEETFTEFCFNLLNFGLNQKQMPMLFFAIINSTCQNFSIILKLYDNALNREQNSGSHVIKNKLRIFIANAHKYFLSKEIFIKHKEQITKYIFCKHAFKETNEKIVDYIIKDNLINYNIAHDLFYTKGIDFCPKLNWQSYSKLLFYLKRNEKATKNNAFYFGIKGLI